MNSDVQIFFFTCLLPQGDKGQNACDATKEKTTKEERMICRGKMELSKFNCLENFVLVDVN